MFAILQSIHVIQSRCDHQQSVGVNSAQFWIGEEKEGKGLF